MIPYHGTPISPIAVLETLAGYRFCVSYEAPRDIGRCSTIGRGVMIDNGAFSAWRRSAATDWPGYYRWVERWPCDFAVIPDVINGHAVENDLLIAQWPHGHRGAPVWHMHEPLARLLRLVDEWPLVCLGSSGAFAVIGTGPWEARMIAAFNRLARRQVMPQLHGLRMLNLVGGCFPLASADSTDIARNHSRPCNTAAKMAERWQRLAARTATTWSQRPEQLELAA